MQRNSDTIVGSPSFRRPHNTSVLREDAPQVTSKREKTLRAILGFAQTMLNDYNTIYSKNQYQNVIIYNWFIFISSNTAKRRFFTLFFVQNHHNPHHPLSISRLKTPYSPSFSPKIRRYLYAKQKIVNIINRLFSPICNIC